MKQTKMTGNFIENPEKNVFENCLRDISSRINERLLKV